MSDTADPPKTVLAGTIVLNGQKFKVSDFRALTDEEHLIEETERKMLLQEIYEVGPEEHGVKFTPRVELPIRKLSTTERRTPMSSTPLDEYLQEKEAAKTKRKADEVALWQKWMDNGQQPKHLQPLLKLYEPVIAMKTRAWKPPMVPESAFKAELQTHLIKAFQNYDPSRGAAINTHVEKRLKKALRYGNRGANLSYIPEGMSGQIGKIQKAKDMLVEDLGRPPTTEELSKHMGMPIKRLETIMKAVKRDVPMGRSGGENYDYSAGGDATTRGFEEQQIAVAQNILPEIFPNKPDLHLVFHHTFGTGGHAKLTTGQLAKKMGKTEPQISRMKTIMGDTLRKHMGLDEEDED